jgi:hypothetical protein
MCRADAFSVQFEHLVSHDGMFRTSRQPRQAANIVVCAEEPAYGDLLNAQAQAPDIQAANGKEKATCFQRPTDSKESLNESSPAAESSPWRPASLPFTFFETHYQFTGRWFRQITPLGIRNARSLGTNAIPKAPRLAHAGGALGPMTQAVPPPIPAGGGGRPWHLFQCPVPGARHSGCFIARFSLAEHSSFTGPIQGPGYTLAARIYGRVFGLPQRPSSSSR